MTKDIDEAKQAARERVWALLEREGAVRVGVHGHIPNFAGADRAAQRLAELEAWRAAEVVKSNPDKAQLPVRVRALNEGKLLYMAVPRLATPKPFYLLDAAGLIRSATVIATTVHQIQVVEENLPETKHDFSVDLIVTPDDVIRCGPSRRPSGIVLDQLSSEKAAEIPVLAALVHKAG